MDLNTKLIMTYFLVFMLAGSAFSIYMSFERTGLDTEGAKAYYAGDEEGMQFPKEATELTETTHFHFFIMPIIFMTTGHLFLMSAWSQRWKTFIISSCFVYIALDLGKPWLIRYGAPGFGILAPINSALLRITMLLCIVVPLHEMWFLRIERPEHPH
tara:strand:+ start:695 stop:1165 length:471 start_codon:yes stop_codon:yes gene_type:complete